MAQRDDRAGPLGPLESEVMELVWSADGPVTVRALHERLNEGRAQPLAYTTVMTVMSRLAEKEVLARRRDGRGYVYEARAADPAAIAVRSVMRDHGNAAMAHFVEAARADPQALRRLRKLLADGE
jgi:predicted transcriptional regulator